MLTTLRRRQALAGLTISGLATLAARLSPAQADSSPNVAIQHLYDALLGVMRAGSSAPFTQRFNQLAPTIDAIFDLPVILQDSIGPNWTGLAANERTALLGAFRRYTIDSYVSSFNNYSGQRFEVTPGTRSLTSQEQVVSSRIIPPSGDSHRLDYVMRQAGGTWKVVDVLAEGTISRVAVQRSDFRHLLMDGGAAALVTSLDNKAKVMETS